MLTLRTRILLIGGGGILSILGILFFLILRDPETVEIPPLADERVEVELPPIENVEFRRPDTLPQSETSVQESPDEIYAKQSARIFVERFWSYSNQNDNQHIEDALALAASGMHEWIRSHSQEQHLTYQGVTTEVLSTRIVSYTPEKAQVEVGARQTTRGIDSSSETVMITAQVDMLKSGTQWLVAGVWLQ